MEKIKVSASTNYDILLSEGFLGKLGEFAKEKHELSNCLIVTDSNVEPLYLKKTENSLKVAGFNTFSYVFPAGEKSKDVNTLTGILEYMAKINLDRNDFLVALGGGVTGDMTGLASGLYKRGIEYIQVPTTLLSAVDSSVGGKTAVNLEAGKNLIGLFKQPLFVLSDPETLKSLPKEILYDGYSECIKYGVLGNQKIIDIFENKNPYENLSEIISESVKMKKSFVENDEFDLGIRAFLNLGHTLGHAVEKCSSFKISHGKAVSIGMVLVTRAGEKNGFTDTGTTEKLIKILKKNHLPVSCNYSVSNLKSGVLSDKKRTGDKITWVIPKEIGKCFLKEIPISKLDKFIESALED